MTREDYKAKAAERKAKLAGRRVVLMGATRERTGKKTRRTQARTWLPYEAHAALQDALAEAHASVVELTDEAERQRVFGETLRDEMAAAGYAWQNDGWVQVAPTSDASTDTTDAR